MVSEGCEGQVVSFISLNPISTTAVVQIALTRDVRAP